MKHEFDGSTLTVEALPTPELTTEVVDKEFAAIVNAIDTTVPEETTEELTKTQFGGKRPGNGDVRGHGWIN